jgi:hypothetical protein
VLAEQAQHWTQKALLYMRAEAEAQDIINKRNQPKGGK